MTNVVSLKPDQIPGEQSFLCCSCHEGSDLGFAPVIIHDAAGWFIAALVCLECEGEITIDGGRKAAE